MGHYALCGHLLPFLGRSDRPTRVVSVSSLAHRLGNPLRLLQELRVDGSELRRLPVEVGSLSHDFIGGSYILSVVFSPGFRRTINVVRLGETVGVFNEVQEKPFR